jgi:hypothetical protein
MQEIPGLADIKSSTEGGKESRRSTRFAGPVKSDCAPS